MNTFTRIKVTVGAVVMAVGIGFASQFTGQQDIPNGSGHRIVRNVHGTAIDVNEAIDYGATNAIPLMSVAGLTEDGYRSLSEMLIPLTLPHASGECGEDSGVPCG